MSPIDRDRPAFPAPGTIRPASALLPVLLSTALLGGCGVLPSKDPTTLYAPAPRVQADPSWPRRDWQLVIATTSASPMIDSPRISVRPTPNEVQVYKSASWARRPSDLLEGAIIHALESANAVRSVSRAGSGVAGDHRLLLDLRRFESDYAGGATPFATIEVNATLVRTGAPGVLASRTFRITRPAAGTAVPQVVDAFEGALAEAASRVSGWALQADPAPVDKR